MARLVHITWEGDKLNRLANTLAAAGSKAPHAIRRAVNHTGDKVRTQMIRTLTKQTGLKRKTIVKALKVRRASFTNATYEIYSAGGNISLKYFGAREIRKGVSAVPRGKRTIYRGAFIHAGHFPNRRFLFGRLGGHVWSNIQGGKWTGRIEKVKSGVFIPAEMVTGATEGTFYSGVQSMLLERVSHEVLTILEGTVKAPG